MKILQINTTVNWGSTGRIMEDIGNVAIGRGHKSYIAYGRGSQKSGSNLIKIGGNVDFLGHGFATAILDKHGFASSAATRRLIQVIDDINPDVIGLHNLHGYYIHVGLLFDYLRKKGTPTLWTLYDCWAFTGHCTYFDDIGCQRWVDQCYSCPKKDRYPASYLRDSSSSNYVAKRGIFTGVENLSLVVHSKWLEGLVKRSFLKSVALNLVNSGIDLVKFQPKKSQIRRKFEIGDRRMILGCASIWDKRKGLDEFVKLNEYLDIDQVIVLVGLTGHQIRSLPPGIVGIRRTENIEELAALYTAADVFVNPTIQDNFPTTNLESLACGTPVITYNTGGSPEALDAETGLVVEKGDIKTLVDAVRMVLQRGKTCYESACRARALKYFNKDDRYADYLTLYETLVNGRN